MGRVTPEEVAALIEANRHFINLGDPNDPDLEPLAEEWIDNAEKQVGHPLTPSYKWYLRNYRGGEIGSEEIYSLYGPPKEGVMSPGDIVFVHQRNQREGRLDRNKIEISWTDYGEWFYFDYGHSKDGECPIYLQIPDGTAHLYAADFYEFLAKRIKAYLG